MIVRVYFDCDMRMGVDGFFAMLKQKRIAVGSLKAADFTLFLNKRKNHFKLLTGHGYMVHFKAGRQLTVADIEAVPKIFGGDRAMLRGENLAKLKELLGKETKVFSDGKMAIVS